MSDRLQGKSKEFCSEWLVAFPANGRGAVRALLLYVGGGNQSQSVTAPPAILKEAGVFSGSGYFSQTRHFAINLQ
jgi:hypothetical protein